MQDWWPFPALNKYWEKMVASTLAALMSFSIPSMASNETQTLHNTISEQISMTSDGSDLSKMLSCFSLPHLTNLKDIQLEYWRTGLYCKELECTFKVESTFESMEFNEESKEGIIVTASASITGRNIFCQLIDLVESPRP